MRAYVCTFFSGSRLNRLLSTSTSLPQFDSSCLTAEHINRPSLNTDSHSAMYRIDANRFFVAAHHSSVASDRPRRYDDVTAGAPDDDLPARIIYVRLDVLRLTLAVVDLFVVLHRCACLSCCCCCCARRSDCDGQLTLLTRPGTAEKMPNGVTDAGGIILCSRHDDKAARQQHKHRTGRTPNGSASRALSSYDVEEVADIVPGGPCPLRRGQQRGSVKSTLRDRAGGGAWRHRWTLERRRGRRQLTALLTRLVLCSIVLSLVYIVMRTLDVILCQLVTLVAHQHSADELLVADRVLGDTFVASQVRSLFCVIDSLID